MGLKYNGGMNLLYILAASIHSMLKAWSRHAFRSDLDVQHGIGQPG